jgi:plasmid stability protein
VSDVLIRGVPDDVLTILKRRAKENRRSLQQELLLIVETAARASDRRVASQVADDLRQLLAATGRTFTDSSRMVREDRDR